MYRELENTLFLQKNRIIQYKCHFEDCDPETKRVKLKVEDTFKEAVGLTRFLVGDEYVTLECTRI